MCTPQEEGRPGHNAMKLYVRRRANSMKLASNMAYPSMGEWTMILNGTSFWALPEVMQLAVPKREYPKKRRKDCFSGSTTQSS